MDASKLWNELGLYRRFVFVGQSQSQSGDLFCFKLILQVDSIQLRLWIWSLVK